MMTYVRRMAPVRGRLGYLKHTIRRCRGDVAEVGPYHEFMHLATRHSKGPHRPIKVSPSHGPSPQKRHVFAFKALHEGQVARHLTTKYCIIKQP